MRNKQSLVCYLKEGSIKYSHYGSWNNTGIALSLSNMQVGYRKGSNLPLESLQNETKEQFTKRVVDIINSDSVCNVVKQVNTEVKFA